MLFPKSENAYTSAGSASYSKPPKSAYCLPAKADSEGVMWKPMPRQLMEEGMLSSECGVLLLLRCCIHL